MKSQCPTCGTIHEAIRYDPEKDRERARDIDYEANYLLRKHPGMSFLEAMQKAKERVECEELHSERA